MSVLADRRVLITGGAGTFGKAFAARCLADHARRVVIFSRGELLQAQTAAALGDDPRLRYFLGDVASARRLSWAMRGVDFVVHAAAMKRIEACEADPFEAIKTNVLGTEHVAEEAILAKVERAVFLSTDKAPSAHTLYGATKFCAERLWLAASTYVGNGPTRFAVTRYGNVLGSRGSVLDIWRKQFAEGKPLTITDARATRFWMTIEQAVDLVVQALTDMRGGETFVPVIGSAPILDLARAVVEANGTYAPGHIETGLKPGERLHETLISAEEGIDTRMVNGAYVIKAQKLFTRECDGDCARGIP